RGNLIKALDFSCQSNTAEREFLAIIGCNLDGSFKFTVVVAAGAKDDSQFVGAGRSVELVFIVIGSLGEFLPFVLFKIQIQRVAESGTHCAIRFVGDAQHVYIGVIFAFILTKVQGLARNIHSQIYTRNVRFAVVIRNLHGAWIVPAWVLPACISICFSTGLPSSG